MARINNDKHQAGHLMEQALDNKTSHMTLSHETSHMTLSHAVTFTCFINIWTAPQHAEQVRR